MENTSDKAPASAPFEFTDDQMNFEVGPVYEDIKEQLRELKASTGCPDSSLKEMLKAIADSL